MALKKDKQKVLGEVFDDARVRSFLQFKAPEGVNEDFHLLEKAYRGMKAENFATFIEFFKADGRDINAQGPNGKTLKQQLTGHRLAEEYLKTLTQQGAQ